MLIKKNRGRMRYIGSPSISIDSKIWQSAFFEFKSFIRDNTQYQLVDNLIYWHCNMELSECFPMIAVIGTPVETHRKVIVEDSDPGPYWVKGLDPAVSIIDMNFEALKPMIKSVLETIPPQMGKSFHLVMNDEKIELHFFLQKDYIG